MQQWRNRWPIVKTKITPNQPVQPVQGVIFCFCSYRLWLWRHSPLIDSRWQVNAHIVTVILYILTTTPKYMRISCLVHIHTIYYMGRCVCALYVGQFSIEREIIAYWHIHTHHICIFCNLYWFLFMGGAINFYFLTKHGALGIPILIRMARRIERLIVLSVLKSFFSLYRAVLVWCQILIYIIFLDNGINSEKIVQIGLLYWPISQYRIKLKFFVYPFML